MPIFEYLCLDCGKTSEILIFSLDVCHNAVFATVIT